MASIKNNMLDKATSYWTGGKIEMAKLIIREDGAMPRELAVQFNPAQLNITRGMATARNRSVTGKAEDKPPVATSQESSSLSVTLYFDSQTPDRETKSASVQDRMLAPIDTIVNRMAPKVNNKINEIMDFTRFSEKDGQPPEVQFVWGYSISFTGYITSCSVRYTMFSSSGSPIRAELSLSITGDSTIELKKASTPMGTIGGKVATVTDSDSITKLAGADYKSAASKSGISKIRNVASGSMLKI